MLMGVHKAMYGPRNNSSFFETDTFLSVEKAYYDNMVNPANTDLAVDAVQAYSEILAAGLADNGYDEIEDKLDREGIVPLLVINLISDN